MDSPIFMSPSAHEIERITVSAKAVTEASCPPFAVADVSLHRKNGEVGVFRIFGPADAAEKFKRFADATNQIFGETVTGEVK